MNIDRSASGWITIAIGDANSDDSLAEDNKINCEQNVSSKCKNGTKKRITMVQVTILRNCRWGLYLYGLDYLGQLKTVYCSVSDCK